MTFFDWLQENSLSAVVLLYIIVGGIKCVLVSWIDRLK